MSGIAAGAATFAAVVTVWSVLVAIRGMGWASLSSGLLGLELAMLALVGAHLFSLGGAPSAKQVGYLVAGVCLLPVVLLGAGDDARGRPLAAAVASMGLVVLVLRLESVL